ncbi:MAG: enoyl-CoA hydratase/isomerase family protein [Corynebacterium casei]|uniref:3-hydroxyisobutyryl-CoA hydrolase n=2 Tax=Corynebacterium casei TaxID=160386 RepID=G7HU83_9CORY|nr:enoyl-CoA hydratase/isomerase family protein [Corynebacterium casei]AHI19410.1 enoyl-CoA hydratase [Corynebacterium casei LMG S-19264]MDN5707166.1 enoyl-CoA hydratase/isomerase family protein [Corynebacterium casei]MDN5729075.1 enoyl-CoA hydratase/isomerase family protein [Corynebacterium casei]MDN5740431.1 enoyl-CoA hydratase/isomerase family protein [Corynebacterium casei]MDN5826651.1 enoyl-CoA hydratase/isomerase family protein [Corynebacterium casei]
MTESVQTAKEGNAGIITLNRPKALNALDLDMIRAMTKTLKAWESDDSVALVIVRGAGDRAFCAGGDIAALYADAEVGPVFFREEYELNHLIATYSKPYVPLMKGIVLGGGVGVSSHGSHRIATDTTRLGMPEVGIGFAPDAGGSYVLAKSRDRLGRHLAYTSVHVGAAEAIDLGFADFYVTDDKLDALTEALSSSGDVTEIEKFTSEPGESFPGDRAEMVDVYSADSVEDTLERLRILARNNPEEHWAVKAEQKISNHPPLSLKVTELLLDRASVSTLPDALTTEYWMSLNMRTDGDFLEGVRAQIIEKDRNPKWSHTSLEEVDTSAVVAILDRRGNIGPNF